MQILQDILGLVQRRIFMKKTSIKGEDVIYIAKDVSKNNIPDFESKALKMKDLSEYVGSNGGQVGPQGPVGPPGENGAPGATGATGPIGPAGPVGAASLNFVGTFDNTAGYSEGDVVFFDGSSYVAKFAIPIPTPPTVLPDPPNTDWDFLSVEGDVGPQGPIGPIGPAGASLWGPAVALTFNGPADTIDLSTGNTFKILITGDTTISMTLPGSPIGDYIFIIDNTGGHIATLQAGSNMYTNNSLQPVINNVTLMKGTSDGTKIYITSLENMENITV